MLRKIRIALATFCYAALVMLFLDFTGTVHSYLGWCAKIQLAPALLAANFAVFLGIILLTLLLGRVYCSVICPLGICQDLASFLASLKKKSRFSYRKSRKALVILRYALLIVFALSAFAVIGDAIAVLLEPYSSFGRMISQLLAPFYKYGNNALAHFAERFGSYAFYSTDIWLKSVGALVIAGLTFVVIFVFGFKSGRGYCNSVCPVGAFLSLFAGFSLLKPRIDHSKCKHCGLCAKNCKAGCIDAAAGTIDYFRCVSCFNCAAKCSSKAILYSMPAKKKNEKEAENLSQAGQARRNLISGSAIAVLGCAAELYAQQRQGDGGLVGLADKNAPRRVTPIVPPGAMSISNFHKRCTGCQLCVSVCPNQILRPLKATKPTLSFERGYCRPECVKCSEVCPTGAINQITVAEKSSIQIGYAVWKEDICLATRTVDNAQVNCDTCMRHCPTGAISMVPKNANDQKSLKIPMIDTNRCIGCGACEQLCPARPHSAIYIEGVEVHKTV